MKRESKERRLNNSELKVMDIVWSDEPVSAKDVTLCAAQRYGWNKNTTYTILKSLVEKQYVRRDEPNFMCTSLVPIGTVRVAETRSLIDRLFGGSPSAFLSAFFEDEQLSPGDIEELRRIIDAPRDGDGK